MTMQVEREHQLLYQRVAARVEGLTEAGTLRVGQRLPSVRKLSVEWKTSISTVLQAYRVLEEKGLVEARPQSGYYVRAIPRPLPPEPKVTRCGGAPTKVSVGDLVMKVLRAQLDPKVVPLGAAVPGPQCLPTQQLNRVSAAVARRVSRGANVYEVPPGCKELRVQVARRYMAAGCALSPDEIVTTCGSQEALGLCLRAVARAGDTIAIEAPTYYGILQTIEVLGMRALEIPTHPRDGVSIDALRYALQERTIRACLFVTNYNNPLGSMMPDSAKRSLVELLAGHDVPLIEDDVYGDCGFDPDRPTVCKAYDTRGLVLLCSSFSKTLAPGYRVGWTAAGRYQADVERLKVTSTLATPTLPQLTIAQFMATGAYERHVRKIGRMYQEQVRQITAAVQRSFPEGTCITRPTGGSVIWVEMPQKVDAMTLHDRALEQGISIAPGPIFSAKAKYTNFIRVSCGYAFSPEIERAIATLGRLVRESP